jgi:tetratricopeptide (TPR) repeat protein
MSIAIDHPFALELAYILACLNKTKPASVVLMVDDEATDAHFRTEINQILTLFAKKELHKVPQTLSLDPNSPFYSHQQIIYQVSPKHYCAAVITNADDLQKNNPYYFWWAMEEFEDDLHRLPYPILIWGTTQTLRHLLHNCPTFAAMRNLHSVYFNHSPQTKKISPLPIAWETDLTDFVNDLYKTYQEMWLKYRQYTQKTPEQAREIAHLHAIPLAEMYLLWQDYETATEVLDEFSIFTDNTDYTQQINIATAYFSAGALLKALHFAKNALALAITNEELAPPHVLLGNIYAAQMRFKKATHHYHNAVGFLQKLNDQQDVLYETFLKLGECHFREQQFRAASQALTTARQFYETSALQPNPATAQPHKNLLYKTYSLLADTMNAKKKYKEALQYQEQAIRWKEKELTIGLQFEENIYLKLGIIYFNLKEYLKARTIFTKAWHYAARNFWDKPYRQQEAIHWIKECDAMYENISKT